MFTSESPENTFFFLREKMIVAEGRTAGYTAGQFKSFHTTQRFLEIRFNIVLLSMEKIT